MATFDADQTAALARIFGTSSDLMSAHLTYFASIITASDKTAVLADITSYVAIEDDNVEVTAGPAGFKGMINPSAKRGLIRRRIAGLLCNPPGSESGGGQIDLVRG